MEATSPYWAFYIRRASIYPQPYRSTTITLSILAPITFRCLSYFYFVFSCCFHGIRMYCMYNVVTFMKWHRPCQNTWVEAPHISTATTTRIIACPEGLNSIRPWAPCWACLRPPPLPWAGRCGRRWACGAAAACGGRAGHGSGSQRSSSWGEKGCRKIYKNW